MRRAALKDVTLPKFDNPDEMPELDAVLFNDRFSRLEERVRQSGLDALVIYADREHGANFAWLTGFEPRFEEALLVLLPGRRPVLLTGPENASIAAASPINPKVQLYPPMGLMGQDRSETPPLAEVLIDAGLKAGHRIGVAGWKYFTPDEAAHPETWLEIPTYLADTLRTLAGVRGIIENAGAFFMDPGQGLRSQLDLPELARFEFAACHTSEAVGRVVRGARPGMTEFGAAKLLQPIGLPQSCHPMLSSGPRAWFGLTSPTSKTLECGDPVTVAYGVQGALNCRAGWLAKGPDDLPGGVRDYVEKLVAPYFEAVVEWLEGVQIGARGGDLYAALMARLGDPFFGVGLNPGHLIHLDEWMHSPIYRGSDIRMASGMALQVDVIPATGSPYFTTNMEDGIALLDARGRNEFAERWPEAWKRIEARRAFMADELGIRLHADLLPLSNIAAWLPPFWLAPESAMAMVTD